MKKFITLIVLVCIPLFAWSQSTTRNIRIDIDGDMHRFLITPSLEPEFTIELKRLDTTCIMTDSAIIHGTWSQLKSRYKFSEPQGFGIFDMYELLPNGFILRDYVIRTLNDREHTIIGNFFSGTHYKGKKFIITAYITCVRT